MIAPIITTASANRRVESVTGDQQADACRHFQKAGEISEPLPDADLVEYLDHSGTPASSAPSAAMKASAVITERVQRVMRRPLPEAAGTSFDSVIRILL